VGFVHVPFSHDQVVDRPGTPSLTAPTMTDAAALPRDQHRRGRAGWRVVVTRLPAQSSANASAR